MKEIAERIKAIRENRGFSQEAFAKALNFERSNISRIESGEKNITDRHINAICAAFNVSKIWLETGAGDMFLYKDNTESPEEKELLTIFRRLTADMREFFLNMGRDLLEKSEKKRSINQNEDEKGAKAG